MAAVVADKVVVELKAKLDQYNSNVISAERQFGRSMDSIERKAGSTEKAVAKSFASMAARASAFAVTGIVAIGTSLAVGAVAVAKYVASLDDLAKKTGTTTTQFQQYKYAADVAGVSSDTLNKGLETLKGNLDQASIGSQRQTKAFAALGINIRDAAGQVKSAGDTLPELADRLNAIPDPAQRSAVAMMFLGDAAGDLEKLTSRGSGGINELADAADRLGIALSTEQIKNAKKISDDLDAIRRVLSYKLQSIVVDNADGIMKLANALLFLVKAAAEVPTVIGGAYHAIEAMVDPAAEARRQVAKRLSERNMAAMQALLPAPGSSAAFTGADAFSKFYGVDKNAISNLLAPNPPKPPKGRKASGPSAAEIEARYTVELARYVDQQLSLQSDLTADYVERNKNAREANDLHAKALIRDIQADKNYSAEQKASLVAAVKATAVLEDRVVNLREQDDLQKEALASLHAAINTDQDFLNARLALARTAEERRDIELKLLEKARQAEEADLDRIIADKGRNQFFTPAQVADAEARKAALPGLYADRAAAARQQNQGPLGQYLNSIPKTVGEIDEQLQSIAANSLQSVEDGFAKAATKALGLHGILGDIVGDLIKMVAQQSILSTFSGGSSSIFGAIGSIFGGGRASGGPVGAGRTYLVGENGPELLHMGAGSGVVVPNHAISAGGSTSTVVQNITVDARNSVNPDGFARHILSISGQQAQQAAALMGRGVLKAVPGRLAQYQNDGT